jgi:hypothetical protein
MLSQPPFGTVPEYVVGSALATPARARQLSAATPSPMMRLGMAILSWDIIYK